MCKRIEGKTFPTLKEAILPSSRVSEDPSFAITGIDRYSLRQIESQKRCIYVFLHAPPLERSILTLFVACQCPHFFKLFDVLSLEEACQLD